MGWGGGRKPCDIIISRFLRPSLANQRLIENSANVNGNSNSNPIAVPSAEPSLHLSGSPGSGPLTHPSGTPSNPLRHPRFPRRRGGVSSPVRYHTKCHLQQVLVQTPLLDRPTHRRWLLAAPPEPPHHRHPRWFRHRRHRHSSVLRVRTCCECSNLCVTNDSAQLRPYGCSVLAAECQPNCCLRFSAPVRALYRHLHLASTIPNTNPSASPSVGPTTGPCPSSTPFVAEWVIPQHCPVRTVQRYTERRSVRSTDRRLGPV